MGSQMGIWAFLVLPITCGQAIPDDHSGCVQTPQCFLERVGPVGGWSPYGGGLLSWWNPCCFPRSGAPDDYCRKPLPKVCWPPYPPYYIWGAPPQSSGEHERAPSPAGTEPRQAPRDDAKGHGTPVEVTAPIPRRYFN